MDAYDRGHAAWQTVTLSRETFESHLRKLGDPGERVEDLFLACACACGDREALRLFEEQLLSQVPAFIARVDSSPAVADELKQRLRARLLVGDGDGPEIARYGGRGALAGWVRVIAVRQLHRMRARKIDRAQLADGDLVERIADVDPGPEMQAIRARYRDGVTAAMNAAVRELSERDRLLLKLALLDELSIDELADFFNVHRATAARWVVALRQQLLEAGLRHVKQRLGVGTADAHSLCALVRSQIDLSMSSLSLGAGSHDTVK